MEPTTADIRRFLGETFSDEELKTLCFDYFRDVSDEFTTGMTKGQMIQLLIERCVRREMFPNLQAALAAERPDQYASGSGPRRWPSSRRNTRLPAVIRARCSSAMRTRTRSSPTGWRPTWRAPAGGLDRTRQHSAGGEVGRGHRPRAG